MSWPDQELLNREQVRFVALLNAGTKDKTAFVTEYMKDFNGTVG